LEGYRGSGPVRIGNAAVSQVQMDVYGEMMDALYLTTSTSAPSRMNMWLKIREPYGMDCENWQRPDAGIWEMRNRQEHFTYSKVMNWVALDRGIRLADKRALPANRAKWLPASGPHLRRSDEPRLEPEASRLHPVLWK